MFIMDVVDVNWKAAAEFSQKYPSPKTFWSRRLVPYVLVVFNTLLDFNGLRMWNMDVSNVN